MKKEDKKRDEAMAYFFERYEKASFRMVPGHWPDFKTKEEVDEYIDATEKIMAAFRTNKEESK